MARNPSAQPPAVSPAEQQSRLTSQSAIQTVTATPVAVTAATLPWRFGVVQASDLAPTVHRHLKLKTTSRSYLQ